MMAGDRCREKQVKVLEALVDHALLAQRLQCSTPRQPGVPCARGRMVDARLGVPARDLPKHVLKVDMVLAEVVPYPGEVGPVGRAERRSELPCTFSHRNEVILQAVPLPGR